MGRNNKPAPIKRYTFSVPVPDKSVLDWLDAQYNISQSLRIIIKDYAAKYGNTDITSLPMTLDDKASVSETVQQKPAPEPHFENTAKQQPKETQQSTNASSMLDDLMK